MFLAAVLVKVTSRGPVLYTQTRLGQYGKLFTIYKIRTMRHNCEHHTGPCWSTPGDPRVLAVGRFLRWSHVDELPQLWNVLRGDMSLVGPRPERPELTPALERTIPHYRKRLLVRPGVTGLAQVQLPGDTDLASVRRKLACDLHYVQRHSLWLDLRILLVTVANLVGIPGRWSRKLLCVPGGCVVEKAYESLPPDTMAIPQVQTLTS
jgi:lipopolysaccharide/colanic/teichoic acid biosynthesis glycosyltransferase